MAFLGAIFSRLGGLAARLGARAAARAAAGAAARAAAKRAVMAAARQGVKSAARHVVKQAPKILAQAAVERGADAISNIGRPKPQEGKGRRRCRSKGPPRVYKQRAMVFRIPCRRRRRR